MIAAQGNLGCNHFAKNSRSRLAAEMKSRLDPMPRAANGEVVSCLRVREVWEMKITREEWKGLLPLW